MTTMCDIISKIDLLLLVLNFLSQDKVLCYVEPGFEQKQTLLIQGLQEERRRNWTNTMWQRNGKTINCSLHLPQEGLWWYLWNIH